MHKLWCVMIRDGVLYTSNVVTWISNVVLLIAMVCPPDRIVDGSPACKISVPATPQASAG